MTLSKEFFPENDSNQCFRPQCFYPIKVYGSLSSYYLIKRHKLLAFITNFLLFFFAVSTKPITTDLPTTTTNLSLTTIAYFRVAFLSFNFSLCINRLLVTCILNVPYLYNHQSVASKITNRLLIGRIFIFKVKYIFIDRLFFTDNSFLKHME